MEYSFIISFQRSMLSDSQQRTLIESARAALPNSCAPYSNFHVAAALITSDGRIYTGVNIESSSYGGTICAEQTALAKALSEGERDLTAIAVVNDAGVLITPCGICRQLLHDYAPRLEVICASENEVLVTTIGELLPLAFNGHLLPIKKDSNEGK